MAPNEVIFQVPLPQMLDLALGTPEVGSVNFNILHNFLHIVLRQTSLNNAKAEYRGDDANRIKAMVASLKASPSFYLRESDVIDIDGNIVQRDYIPDRTVISANVYAIDDQIPQKNNETDEDIDSIFMARIVQDSEEVDQTDSNFELISIKLNKKIDEAVNHINNRLTELEMNFEYLHDNILNLRNAINKSQLPGQSASSVSEKEYLTEDDEEENDKAEENEEENDKAEENEAENDRVEDNDESEENDKIVELRKKKSRSSSVDKVSDQDSRVSGLTTAGLAINGTPRQFSRSFNYSAQLNDIKEDLDSLKNDMIKIMEDVAEMRYHVDELMADKEALEEKIAEKEALVHEINDAVEIKSVGHVSSERLQTASEAFIDEVVDVSSITTLPGSRILTEDQSDDGDDRKSSKKHVSQVTLVNKLEEDLDIQKSSHGENLKSLDSRIKVLERKINFDGLEGIKEIKDIVQNMYGIEIDIERMNNVIDGLNKQKDIREQNMDILMEQIEFLKIMKVNREDLKDVLANKADAALVDRKVSYDRFDSAYDKLAHDLEDAILKSNKQEYLWKEALDSVQQEIDSKLDKTDGSSIQESMNEKLKALHVKLKELTIKKRESEAAGGKKILTDLQCIACDRDVIMKMEHKTLDYPDPMPYRTSIKPYLTYKLDQMRKHQRQFPAKDINQFTAVVQEMNRTKFPKDHIMEKPGDHFVNRYCGGSHTITTPQQRVMRPGHFFAEWGPEIIQLTEGVVRGTDGQLYHGRPMPPGAINMPEVCGSNQNTCCDEKH